jgi:chorismate dehydratase
VRVGRIPYVNCYPVYGAIDRGVIRLAADLIDGVPTALNRQMAAGLLDVSVVSAVEYARNASRYLLLPDLAISCDGPVRSVALFSKRSAEELDGRRVMVSRSSMTSAALLELLFEHVWRARPQFIAGDAELSDLNRFDTEAHEARLVIGDAALLLTANRATKAAASYEHVYDLGREWKAWTGLPFVFAVWVAQRATASHQALEACAALRASRDWGLAHLAALADRAAAVTGVDQHSCLEYLSGLDYGLSPAHLAGLTEFLRRLVVAGRVPDGSLVFLPAA